jgi:hypothetical protein
MLRLAGMLTPPVSGIDAVTLNGRPVAVAIAHSGG